jgi:tetratricopeptide (TPR) repeat protein
MRAYRQGRHGEAAERFEAARRAYLASGDRAKGAEMANNLCVALLQAGRPAEALRAVEGTPEVFASLGDGLAEGQAYGNLGAALHASGAYDAAEAAYQTCADLLARAGAHEARAHALRALSEVQLRRGRPLEALGSMQRGLEDSPRPGLRERWLRRLLDLPWRLLRR